MEKLTDAERSLAQSLLSAIVTNGTVATPIYCPEVKSEADASVMADELPLVYIWNEDRSRGSFSISINGRVVGSILEQQVDRANPSFARIRDEVMNALRQASQNSIVSTCERLGATPSVVFAR